MRESRQLIVVLALSAGGLVTGACSGGQDRTANTANGSVAASGAAPTTTTTAASTPAPATHHSKLAGAAVGAVAGHMLGGHAVAGAAAGALLQHERNKHSR